MTGLACSLSDKLKPNWFESEIDFGVHQGARMNGQEFYHAIPFPTPFVALGNIDRVRLCD
jgi:hypothetical protein